MWRVVALAAVVLVLELASKIAWYSGVSGACWPSPPACSDPSAGAAVRPLAVPVRIFGVVERLRAGTSSTAAASASERRRALHDHACISLARDVLAGWPYPCRPRGHRRASLLLLPPD